MKEAIIFTQKGDSKEDLDDMVRQLERADISYRFGKAYISESYLPVVMLDDNLYEGSKQLFNYLEHRKNVPKGPEGPAIWIDPDPPQDYTYRPVGSKALKDFLKIKKK